MRHCRRCGGPMSHDLGPADDPDPVYGVRIESVWRCGVCRAEVAVHVETWSDTEIQRRCRAVREIQSVADLDERAKVLAEHGYEMGWRP